MHSLSFNNKNDGQHYLDFSGASNLAAHELTKAIINKNPFIFDACPKKFSHLLIENIARHEAVRDDAVLLGNGGTDLIWLCLHSLAPKEVLLVGPLPPEYEKTCKSLSIPYSAIKTKAQNNFAFEPKDLEQIWTTRADLIVLSTPNNPTGITYPNFNAVFNMLRAPRLLIDGVFREYLFGTDAYYENSYSNYKENLRPGVNLFVLHSFSHFFDCQALRLGYVLGDYMQIRQIMSSRPNYGISPYAQSIGNILISSLDEYRATLPELENMLLKTSYTILQSGIFNQDQIFNGPGFVCAGMHEPNKVENLIVELRRRRIKVYDCSQASNMPKGFIRFQARPDTDLEILDEALRVIADKL